jgi:hypothetical protein
VTEVNNLMWHFGCFKCQYCQAGLTKGYVAYQNMPYCDKCYHIVNGTELCGKCHKPLTGQCSKIGGTSYHADCMVCGKCKKKVGGTAGAKSLRGIPYCNPCFENTRQSTTHTTGSEQSTTIPGQRMQGFTVDGRTGQKVYK